MANSRAGATLIYPVHNRAGFLNDTLSGLSDFDVDWDKSEILVIDDCSTDHLHEVLAKYSGRLPIRCLSIDSSKHPLAGGRSHPITPVYAINYAVLNSTTEYVIPSCPEVSPSRCSPKDSMECFINYPLQPKQCLFATVFHQFQVEGYMKNVAATLFWPFFFFGKVRRADWISIGGYEEAFIPYVSMADTELESRMSRNGFTYLFFGEPIMIHCWHPVDDFSLHPIEFTKAKAFVWERYKEKRWKSEVSCVGE